MTKTKVRFFVSYAHNDKSSCERLLKLLKTQMAPSAKYEFELWDDRAILSGEKWRDEILNALEKCDLGLLFVSPAFLGSSFITTEELPAFIGNDTKPAIPVEIQSVSFDKHDLNCLLYTSPSPRDQRGSRMPSSA